MCSYAELFLCELRREQPWRWRCWEVGAPGFLAPSPRARLLAPPPSQRSYGTFFVCKAPHRSPLCEVNFVNLTPRSET
jgi:hypothetical protein